MRKQDSRNSLLRDERGVVAVIVVIMLPVFVGFAALAIDISYALWTRTELQHTASAAALAGVLDLIDEPADGVPDTDDYRKKGVEYAYKNMPLQSHGRILHTSCGTYDTATGAINGSNECADVKAGNWNPATRVFTDWDDNDCTDGICFNAATMELDAVKVYTHRSQANSNPLNLFLAPAVGLAQTDVNTYAVAWSQGGAPPDSCYQNGLLAGGMTDIQSSNSFTNDFCVYGHCGILINQDNSYSNGDQSAVGPVDAPSCPTLPPVLDADPGENCSTEPPYEDCMYDTFEGNVPAPGYQPELALEWGEYMFPAIEFSGVPVLPDYLAHPVLAVDMGTADTMSPGGEWDPAYWENEPTCTSGGAITTYYVVVGIADISSWSAMCDVAIIADKITIGSHSQLDNVLLISRDYDWALVENPEFHAGANIEIGSYVTMDNIILASHGDISLGSNATLGGELCDSNSTSIQIYASNDVTFQSNPSISNAEIASGHDVNMGTDLSVNLNGTGATIQAENDVTVQSNGTFGACPAEQDQAGEGEGEGEGGGGGGNIGFNNRLVD